MGHKSNRELMERVERLPVPKTRWQRWVVTGGGVGFLRPAPGSWGTLVPAVLFYLALMGGLGEPQRSVWFLGFGMIASGLLIAYGKWAAAYFREPDPGSVVLDEYAGFGVAVAFVPEPAWFVAHGWVGALLFTSGLYVLFRLTDTLKLPPANWLERLPWGWGILCDDLAAGWQANVVAQFIVWMWF